MNRTVKTALIGLGHVNRSLLRILLDKEKIIAREHGLHFRIVGVSDSSGIAVAESGFGYDMLLNLKLSGKSVNTLQGWIEGAGTETITDHCHPELLVEASPLNLQTGFPGLQTVKHALTAGIHVVLANKGPLVLAFDELMQLKKEHHAGLKYSATVCGGLPVINVLTRDLRCAGFTSIQGIFNATSNFVLHELGKGNTMENAIAEAMRIGAAETDPTNDLSGQDTANKLFIIMKSVTDFAGHITDIETEGIQAMDQRMVALARQQGKAVKLIAQAKNEGGKWQLSVKPLTVPASSFLGSCNGWEMAIEVKTDLYESISMKNLEADPLGTAAAVLRDMIEVARK